MANEVEKIEVNQAVANVTEADNKVKKIEMDRAAKRAAKQEKRLGWKGPFKVIGKLWNEAENHPGLAVAGVLTGGVAGAALVLGVQEGIKYVKGSKVADETTDELEVETEVEVTEAPFDTEA